MTSLQFCISRSIYVFCFFFFFSSRRRHTRWPRDWSSDVCSSDLVAAARAARTDGLRAVQVPDAHREAEVAVGEGAHRADVHDVAGVLVGELRPREEPDLRVIAAVEDAELTRARDLVAKPHAARAEDAPLRVQHDVRAEGHRLRLVHLLVPHARVVEAVLHVVDL